MAEMEEPHGRNGGAQQTVWEILMEMERFKYRAGEEDLGAVALVLDLATAFERVSLPVVRAWAAPDSHGHLARVEALLEASVAEDEHQSHRLCLDPNEDTPDASSPLVWRGGGRQRRPHPHCRSCSGLP